MSRDIKRAFSISLHGARLAEIEYKKKGALNRAYKLLNNIRGIDSISISCACKLVAYDEFYRNPESAIKYNITEGINPDELTVRNIKILVDRSLRFWDMYGPVFEDGFTFGPYGYTGTVTAGDGDFLSYDTLWDFKVTKKKITSKHTLQILMYWIMGQHSGNPIFKNIDKIGIFNPRLNEVYRLDVNNISTEVIQSIERDVICY